MALYPNLNYEDSVWRMVLQDVRFRRALSLAMDRREINLAVFFGLCRPSANTVLPQSSLYREEYASAYAAHDPQAANALLDAMGLARRGRDGFRLLADGRRAEIIVETAGEDPAEAISLELITDYWRAIGIKLVIRSSQTDILRSRIIAGKTMMAMASGLDNGIPTPDMDPKALAPTSHEQLQWPLWGVHFESRARMGSKPEMKEAAELLQLYERWRAAATTHARTEIWHQMLALYTDQVFSIGLVNSAYQPIVVSKNLRNVPDKAIYGFDPTAYFGVYGMDTFWFDTRGQ